MERTYGLNIDGVDGLCGNYRHTFLWHLPVWQANIPTVQIVTTKIFSSNYMNNLGRR